MIKLKRVYDPPSNQDGFRVLVDRLWPRGLSKDKAKVDYWMKEIAPSDELRKWYGHDPDKWEEFRSCYELEIDSRIESIQFLMEKGNRGNLTLLFAAKDILHNNAVVLRDYLRRLHKA